MSIKKSGLWCDLCSKPIFHDPYWNISLNGKLGNFHSCDKCKKECDKGKDNVIENLKGEK